MCRKHRNSSACLSTAFVDEYFSSGRNVDWILVSIVDWTRGAAGAKLKGADKSPEVCQHLIQWRKEYAKDAKVLDSQMSTKQTHGLGTLIDVAALTISTVSLGTPS